MKFKIVDGLTLSGGDPLFPESREVIASLVKEVKEKYPNKTIWCYTGFIWEELKRQMDEDNNLKDIINNIDVLLDGKFILRLALEKLQYVGSSNQNIISLKNQGLLDSLGSVLNSLNNDILSYGIGSFLCSNFMNKSRNHGYTFRKKKVNRKVSYHEGI